MIDGEESGGGFASLVEHPMPPRALAAPLHRHSREDEYSFVLEGRLGALLGDEVVYGAPGDLVFKPRGQWHTFWNAGDEPARILEIISPAGFERYFAEVVGLLRAGPPRPSALGEIASATGSRSIARAFPVSPPSTACTSAHRRPSSSARWQCAAALQRQHACRRLAHARSEGRRASRGREQVVVHRAVHEPRPVEQQIRAGSNGALGHLRDASGGERGLRLHRVCDDDAAEAEPRGAALR